MNENTNTKNTQTPEELFVAAIMRKKAGEITPTERAVLAAEIKNWEAHRNDA
jgi:hypothetical protein